MNKSLTVVVVNYNNERYIQESILSVIHQTKKPDELIVVDDKSTDCSVEIIKSMQQQFKFKSIFSDVNLGAAGNRDKGIRNAASDFVVCLDSDDLFKPDYVENIKLFLDSADVATILVPGFIVVDERLNELDKINTSTFCKQNKLQQLAWLAGRKRGMPGNQIVFAKSWYLSLNGYNASLKLYEDWDFQIRSTISNCKWKELPAYFYYYRKNPKGLSSSSRIRHFKYQFRILRSFIKKSKQKQPIISGILYLIFKKGFLYLSGKRRIAGHN